MILPFIFAFFASWPALTPATGGGGAEPAPRKVAAVPGPRLPPQEAGPTVTIVAGTGDVETEWVDRVRRTVDSELPSLLAIFDGKPKHAFFVFVHATRDSMPPALAANLHSDSPAFALLGQHQIHLVAGEIRRLGSPLAGVVRHELVHELLDQYVAPNGRVIPRWFHEGLAQHLAGDTYLRASEDDLVWGISTKRLPSFGTLATKFPSESIALRQAYAQSYSYVSFLARRYGLRDLLRVARAADDFTSFSHALVGRLGRSTYDLEEAWRDHVLHGSGAPWRVAFDQCFTFAMIGLLPVLVVALMRHLQREQRVRRKLIENEERALAAAEAAARAAASEVAGENDLAKPAGADDGNPDNNIESRPPPG